MKNKKPLIIGLTGSIGMGKSTVAKMLATKGAMVFDADQTVHALLDHGGKAVRSIKKLFPETFEDGAINRQKLGLKLTESAENRGRIEAILHPLVWKARDTFMKGARKNKARIVVWDIPLLYETGVDKECDLVFCVWCPYKIQKERLLKRKGMTADKIKKLVAAQKPIAEKKKQANVVFRTDVSLTETKKAVATLYKLLVEKQD